MQLLDFNRKPAYISRLIMEDENLSILSEQRTAPLAGTEVYPGAILRCHNYACSYETYDDVKKCPMCGRNMLDNQQFRVLGGILIGLGAILTATGGALIYLVIPRIPKNDDGRAAVAIAIFIAIFAAGLIVLVVGVRQAFTGDKNRTLTTVMLAGFGLIIFLAVIARYLF